MEPLYNSDLVRGSIDTIILSVLLREDNYGYQIIKEIYRKSGQQYELKEPTLYS
ncbi:PadR family transcriptional regulator, partial [Paenibacillus senegalensis]|uniref:PadR family transcriptional regulator n=1 Tax=Paenibacillus senegalensis TaxID=1465766 RepID=UPI000287C380